MLSNVCLYGLTLHHNADIKIRNRVGYEWHLLKLFGMAIFADVLAGDRTGFGEQRVGFWSSLDGSGFDAARPIAYPLLSDQDNQAIFRLVTVDVLAMMSPGDPKLQGVLETELTRQPVSA